MKLIKILVATFALLSIATPPSHAQNFFSALQNALTGSARGGSNGLPPTNLDSFVYQSGYNTNIYGDEGTTDIPPLDSFQKQNRINAGINGQNAAGLTTGHGSYMPDAWGADEFLAPPGEWDMTGSGSNNGQFTVSATQLNATQAAQAALAAAAQAASLASYPNQNGITVNANVNGTPISATITPPTPAVPTPPTPPAVVAPVITFMTNPPAFISAFGSWATQTVPYAVTQGMVPVQDSTNGLLMGWMAPGQSLSQFLSGQTGTLLPSETAEAQTMLQNLSPSSNYVVPGG
jgi:hypothetical protein